MCTDCFHATDHDDHNVAFYLAQQPGGCCDCGDSEAWRELLRCPLHPPELPQASSSKTVRVPDPPWMSHKLARPNIPAELCEHMCKTVAYALDFILDTLDYSPEEAVLPVSEAELRRLPSADPLSKDIFSMIVWNDDKHSFEEFMQSIHDATGRTIEDAYALAQQIDEQVHTNMSALTSWYSPNFACRAAKSSK